MSEVPDRCIPLMTTVGGVTFAVKLEALRETLGLIEKLYSVYSSGLGCILSLSGSLKGKGVLA